MDEKAKVALNCYSNLYCLIYRQEAYQAEAYYFAKSSVCLVWCELPFGIVFHSSRLPEGTRKEKKIG